METRFQLIAHPLIERLSTGIVLADGTMGTMLIESGHSVDACLEALNISASDDAAAIHRSYISAGADKIGANTLREQVALGQPWPRRPGPRCEQAWRANRP